MGQSIDNLKVVMQFTLTKNMVFFEKQFPHLFEKFRTYKPKQAGLGFDHKGRLNLMCNQGALYPLSEENNNISSLCKQQIENYFKDPFLTVFKMTQRTLQGDSFHHIRLLRAIVELGDAYIDKSEASSLPVERYPKIPFFVMFGVGIGLHLDQVFERRNDINHLIIYEPNLDFFYASMHLVDYERLCREFAKPGKSFSLFIGINQFELFNKVYRLLYQVGIYKSAIFYVMKHYNTPELNESFQFLNKKISVMHTGFGFLEDELISAKNYHLNVEKKCNFLSSEVQKPLDMPVFICANGPSIDHSLAYIKANREKMYLISCGTVLGVFCKNGIKPDIHIEIERTEIVSQAILAWDPKGEYTKDIELVTNNTISPSVIALFKRTTFFLKPNDYSSESLIVLSKSRYKKYLHLYFSNPTVFNAALSLAIHFQSKQIYCLGADLGFHDDAYHHSKDSVYYNKEVGIGYSRGDPVDHIDVEANFGGTVKTDMIYNWSREIAEELLRRKPEDCTVYNTSDGAKIDGTVPIQLANIPPLTERPDFERASWVTSNHAGVIVSASMYRKKVKKCLQKSIEVLDYCCHPAYKKIHFDDNNIYEFLVRNHTQIRSLEGQISWHPVIRLTEGSVLYVNCVVLGYLRLINKRQIRNEFSQKVVPLYMDYFSCMKGLVSDFIKDF